MKKHLLILITLFALTACTTLPAPQPTPEPSPTPPTPQPSPQPTPTPAPSQNLSDSGNQFALDLYKYYQSEEGNLFFSPFSISSALAMAYEGAKGETAEQMQKTLHLPKDAETRRQEFRVFNSYLNASDKPFELQVANALWVEKTYQLEQDYVDLIATTYQGGLESLDFQNQPQQSAQTINSWVADKTNNLIKDLVPADSITPLTRLILTNAIYFKGDWVKQFNPDDNVERDFYLTPDDTTKVEMMISSGEMSRFKYAENEVAQFVELPYSGDELSMLVILPQELTLENLDQQLTLDNLNSWRAELKKQKIELLFPKFKLETSYRMADTLKEMGMPIAFSTKADFSGISGRPELMISSVIHKAFVEVSEEGTEAAAATSVGMELTSIDEPPSRPPLFKADHPFIFMIQHNETGSILFMGRVVNPQTGN